jgi:hypothetical protein
MINRKNRSEGRSRGQVIDLIIMKKNKHYEKSIYSNHIILYLHDYLRYNGGTVLLLYVLSTASVACNKRTVPLLHLW